MSYLLPLNHYHPLLDMSETEQGIKVIKEFFADNLSTALRLRRVTAPLFVLRGLGINDDLSGTERAVNFPIKDLGDARAEVVHSLAKWKRLTLAEYQIAEGYGIYTDMNAIRADEELGNLQSLYVDQWDWERVIAPENRTVDFLKQIVRSIYAAMQRTEYLVCERFPQLTPQLSEEISFIHAETLRQRYPNMSAKEREDAITRELGAVFVIGIGGKLGDGKPHDLRAPDYDDYSTRSEEGLPGLNGDLLVVERSVRSFAGTFLNGHPCGQGGFGTPTQRERTRRPPFALFPPTTARWQPTAQCRRWYWSKSTLHVLSAKGAHRRNPSLHLARRNATILQRNGHSFDLNIKNSQKIYQY